MNTLLFHHLFDNKRFPHSLSEISVETFEEICSKLKSSGKHFSTISKKSSDSVSIIFDDGFQSNLRAGKILNNHNIPGTFFITTAHLSGESTVDVYKGNQKLTADEIIKLHEMGHEIGSHTVHHLDVTLLSREDLRKELREPKESLEEIIKVPVESLSVPYGIWNENVVETALEIGYKNIVVYNYTEKAKEFDSVIPSYGVYPFDSAEDVVAKVKGSSRLVAARTSLIPHFAKGSPLAAFSSLYRKLPLPWFLHRKENKKAN